MKHSSCAEANFFFFFEANLLKQNPSPTHAEIFGVESPQMKKLNFDLLIYFLLSKTKLEK